MKYARIGILLLALCSLPTTALDEAQSLTPDEAAYQLQLTELWDSLARQQGPIDLPNGVASLQVPESFYYLSPGAAEQVLVEIWGNPPGAGTDTMGMLFPAETTPFDSDSWAVIIEYQQDGYVSDEDADHIDYHQLLTQMQADTTAASEQRVAEGFEPIELVGWATEPFYDKENHKLHWAKELKFGEQPVNTLNYNIRVLGRQGVLILNFVADMDQKPLIDSEIDTVLAMAEFKQGQRYRDFDPSVDQVAAYGLGALVAGKVATKLGLLSVLLVFLKKFGVVIAAGVGVLSKNLFKRNKY